MSKIKVSWFRDRNYIGYYLKLGPTWHNEQCRNQDGKPVIEGQSGEFPRLADTPGRTTPGASAVLAEHLVMA